MITSVTELGTKQRCDWQHNYGSFNGRALTKIISPVALSLGKLIHSTQARWEMEYPTTLYLIFIEEAERELARIKETYRARVGANVSERELESFYELTELGREICVNYEECWGTPLPDDFRVIQPEQTLVVDVPGSEHTSEWNYSINDWIDCPHAAFQTPRLDPLTGEIQQFTVPPCNGYHQLEGTLDSLIQNIDDIAFIRERKTYDKRPTLLSLMKNDQFLGYQWMEQMLNASAPFQIAGMAYDGMWKRTRVDKRGKVRSNEDLFLRKFLTRSQREVANYQKWLPQRIAKIAGIYPNPPTLEPNRAWMGCWDCMFEELCTTEMEGEDPASILQYFTLRTKEDREDLWPEIAGQIMSGDS